RVGVPGELLRQARHVNRLPRRDVSLDRLERAAGGAHLVGKRFRGARTAAEGDHEDHDDERQGPGAGDAVQNGPVAQPAVGRSRTALLRRLHAARRRRRPRLLLRHRPAIQAETARPPKNSATATASSATGHAGSAARNARPYRRVRSRGSRIATTPRSAWPRISRPNPWRSWSIAVGSA